MKTKCCIICGGPESCNELVLNDEYYVICADSGYNKACAAGITPDLVLGDFDSIDGEVTDKCEIISAPRKKDDTDTMLAVKTALERGYKEILLAGACGGRTDHTIANIATLMFIREHGASGYIAGDENAVYLIENETLRLLPKKNCYLSVFSVSEKSVVSIVGAEYELDRYEMHSSFPIGVSNEFTERECEITAHSGIVIVMTVAKQ